MALAKDDKIASPAYVEDFIRAVLSERRLMQPNQVINYSIGTLVGATNVDKYDLGSIAASSWVRDTGAGSPTLNLDVEGSAVVLIGIDFTAGTIRFVNVHSMPVDALLRATIRRKVA